MGSAHAVFILMEINLRIIGIALRPPLLRLGHDVQDELSDLATGKDIFYVSGDFQNQLSKCRNTLQHAFSNSSRVLTAVFVAIGGTFPEDIGEQITERCWSSGVCVAYRGLFQSRRSN